jgi:hypothetical protein
MMGPRQIEQAALFCEFSLERHVPATRSAGQHHLDARGKCEFREYFFRARGSIPTTIPTASLAIFAMTADRNPSFEIHSRVVQASPDEFPSAPSEISIVPGAACSAWFE